MDLEVLVEAKEDGGSERAIGAVEAKRPAKTGASGSSSPSGVDVEDNVAFVRVVGCVGLSELAEGCERAAHEAVALDGVSMKRIAKSPQT